MRFENKNIVFYVVKVLYPTTYNDGVVAVISEMVGLAPDGTVSHLRK
jgi:hypothetical protein